MKIKHMKKIILFLVFFSFINCANAEIKLVKAKDVNKLRSLQTKVFGKVTPGLKMSDHGKLVDINYTEHNRFKLLRSGNAFDNANLKITVKKGALYRGNKLLVTQDRSDFIFIMDNDGEIYGVQKAMANDGVFHSSLIGDEWPVAAGTLETDAQGRLIKMSNSSGHFKPPPERTRLAVKSLKKMGADISSDFSFTDLGVPDENGNIDNGRGGKSYQAVDRVDDIDAETFRNNLKETSNCS